MFLKLTEVLILDRKEQVLVNMEFVVKMYEEEKGSSLWVNIGEKAHRINVIETCEEIMEMLRRC